MNTRLQVILLALALLTAYAVLAASDDRFYGGINDGYDQNSLLNNTIPKFDQTITFPAIPAQALTNGTLTLSATASSGLPVTFTLISGLGTLDGNVLTFNAVGENTIKASQAGDSNYVAAADITHTFPVYDSAAAPTTNTIPWSDNFETYFNLVPLINGTNGWYGSSADIIVETNIVRTGTNAAMIPVDCILSNRFISDVSTNVWIQMDLRPQLYDGPNTPTVDTNVAWIFYVNSNGNFVVHNGPATNPTPTNSASWVTNDNVQIPTNGTTWVRINIYEDFSKTNWSLYADGGLVTNAIGFINTNLTNFTGLDLFNGVETTYLDNVSVTTIDTNNPIQRPLIVIPPTPAVRTYFVSDTPSLQTVKVYNVWSDPIGFEIATDKYWLAASPANGIVDAGTTTDVTLTYARTLGWQPGTSNAVVSVVATNGTDRWGTQTVALVINMIGYGSGITNTIPFYDDFEYYANQTPLVDGINGWYGSLSDIVVQQDVKWAGLQAAMIPVGCTLSNPFVPASTTNVWLQMNLRPSLSDGLSIPVVDTTLAVMFYINSNGNFVVHNGPASDPTNSANWVTLTNGGIGTSGTNWVMVGIYEDFARKKCDLYANGVLLTNNINFINPALTNFTGFNVYNGVETIATYMDNVSVTASNRTAGYIGLSTKTLAYAATYGGALPANQTVVMTNLGETAFTYSNTVSYGSGAGWLTVAPVVGELAGSATQNLTCAMTNASLNAGVYVATNTISSPGFDATNAPQTIVATLTVSKATATVTNWGTATAITYGQAFSNSVLSGVAATNAAGANVPGTNTFDAPATIPNAGITNVSVTFTPDDTNYYTVAGTVSVTVGKQTPTVSTPLTASTITYGQALSNSVLSDGTFTNSAGTDVPGTNTFDAPATIPNAGTAAQPVTFTPTDTNNYNTVAGTVSVTVNKAAQTISFPAIPAQPSGNLILTLSATASSGLPVSFTNTAGAGTIDGDVITFNGVGENTVKASQTGNVNYAAAVPEVTHTFPVYNSTATPMTNTIPYTNNFENYFNLEPLINGTNGWYGSSADIIVQTNIVRTETKAAMIPVDCTLSNRFVSTTTNVWMQMEIRPRLLNVTNTPMVDTNFAGMFYINSNGNFVVHNGPTSDPTNSANWVTLTNGGIGTTGTNWVTVGIYEDFTRKKWDLYTNGVLVTNNINFINPALTNFTGFDAYNGASTSYLDDVSVTVSNRTAGYIGLSTTTLTYTATYGGALPVNQIVVMTNLGETAFTYSNTVSYGSGAGWLTVAPVVGELAGSATQNLTCAMTNASLNSGVYVATNTISSPGLDATNAPRTIVATLTVNKATATVTNWGTATALIYGQAFSNSVLSGVAATNAAGANVPGTNTFDAPATIPNAGITNAPVTFTPDDTNYNTVAGTVSVTVSKQTPTVTNWGTATDIIYGQALSNSTLSGVAATNAAGADVPGTNTFDAPATVPNAGTAAQPVTFTPADTNNYNTVAGTVNVTVNKATQTISFPAIPAQPSGNLTLTLSATASSGLPVSFTNTAGAGTIDGNVITFNGVGENTVKASQTGNVNYAAAADVMRTFPVYDSTAAPTTNTIPYTNNFENYFNLEPLINGTNGWYGSSADIIVQTNIVATGTKAAMIPGDCTLSNLFVAGTPLNVQIAMDSRPVRSDLNETNFPMVDTNATYMFYVDTNGHFVVCNGLGTTSTWCMVSNAIGSGSEFVVTNNTWTHIVIYLDYRHRNWKLKANNILITNKIGFVTQQTNGFSGFEVISGLSSTSYLDNVSVNWWDRFKVNGVLDHLIRSVNGVIPDSIIGLPSP